jgi:hypothetical protein
MTYQVVLTDTGPLITLAAAKSLDLLLEPGKRIIVPDMVVIEATRYPDKPGAADILHWVHNTPTVNYVETNQAQVYYARLKLNPAFKGKDYGEFAAIEVLNKLFTRDPSMGAIMLWEDGRIGTFDFRNGLPPNVELMTTNEFLSHLEVLGVIPSAAVIFDRAQAAMPDRNIDRLRNQLTPQLIDPVATEVATVTR